MHPDDPCYSRLSAAEESALWADRAAEADRLAEISAEEAAREAAELAETAAWEARQEALERDLLAYEIAAGFRAPDGTLCDIGPARPFSERAVAGVVA